jgi:hypothetical protein
VNACTISGTGSGIVRRRRTEAIGTP